MKYILFALFTRKLNTLEWGIMQFIIYYRCYAPNLETIDLVVLEYIFLSISYLRNDYRNSDESLIRHWTEITIHLSR